MTSIVHDEAWEFARQAEFDRARSVAEESFSQALGTAQDRYDRGATTSDPLPDGAPIVDTTPVPVEPSPAEVPGPTVGEVTPDPTAVIATPVSDTVSFTATPDPTLPTSADTETAGVSTAPTGAPVESGNAPDAPVPPSAAVEGGSGS